MKLVEKEKKSDDLKFGKVLLKMKCKDEKQNKHYETYSTNLLEFRFIRNLPVVSLHAQVLQQSSSSSSDTSRAYCGLHPSVAGGNA